jgi:hypothetical protein
MATRHKLTIETLTELGARKLAELLLAEAAGNRQLKQTLNLAISAKEGPAALAMNLRKRFTTLANSHSMPSDETGHWPKGEGSNRRRWLPRCSRRSPTIAMVFMMV